MQTFLLILISLFSGTSYSQECNPGNITVDDCSFYRKCIEEKISCGTRGYALSYGEYYCNRFTDTFQNYETHFSPMAHKWREATSICLQKSLAETMLHIHNKKSPSKLCRIIKKSAYKHHTTCYTQLENSICFLPRKDLNFIFKHRIIRYKHLFLGMRGLKQLHGLRRICIQQLNHLRNDERSEWWINDFESLSD